MVPQRGHPILQLVPILEQILEQVEKKLNASNQQNRKQKTYPDDGQCRPARVVAHTTYSLYEVRETQPQGGPTEVTTPLSQPMRLRPDPARGRGPRSRVPKVSPPVVTDRSPR